MNNRQSGFTLIAAIFLLVAVAALVVYVSQIRTVQQTTLVYGVQGARAMQAARAGIEWGIYQSLTAASCPATTSFPVPGTGPTPFNVQVSCTQSTHQEADTAIVAYQLTAVASLGTLGSLDYVQRRLQATVSLDPP